MTSSGLREETVLSMLGFLMMIPGCHRKADPSQPPVSQCQMACPVSEKCDRAFCYQLLIPGGSFLMGSDEPPRGMPPHYFGGLDRLGDHRPAHTVELEPFCIDKYEVTAERYEACVRAGFCDPGGDEAQAAPGASAFRTHVNHYPDQCMNRGERCPTCPVNCRSHQQAQAYCAWIGRRLCTEAEWERAASGPGQEKRPYPWGFDPIDGSRANVAGLGPGCVLPVDSLPKGASLDGVLNLAGNVFEWVEDPYRTYHDTGERRSDPASGGDLRIGRGGCFHIDTGYLTWERTTFHHEFDWGCIGIRCCAAPVISYDSPGRRRAGGTPLPPLDRKPADPWR